MISDFFGGILNVKKHTVLKAKTVLLIQKTGQSHQKLPGIAQNWTRIIQSHPKLHRTTQNYPDATIDK